MSLATPSTPGSILLAGDFRGSGSSAISPALTETGVTAGSYANTSLVVDPKGRVLHALGLGSRATTAHTGVVEIGTNIDVAAGVISLATATSSVLGVVSVPTSSNLLVGGGRVNVDSSKVPLRTLTNTFTKSQSYVLNTVTDAATVVVDGSLSYVHVVTLGGNRTLSFTGQTGKHFIIIKQDGTGNRTLSFPASFKFPTGMSKILSTAANAIDLLTVEVGNYTLCSLQKAFS